MSDGNPIGVAINISTAGAGEEVVSPKSWMENPMGVALTIDAPLPPIPQEPIPQQEEGVQIIQFGQLDSLEDRPDGGCCRYSW